MIANLLQIFFETCYLFSLELTYRPTALDRRFDPDIDDLNNESMQNNQEKKDEPDCEIIVSKCAGEIIAISIYIGITILFLYLTY